jgi:hypothetical protein
MHYWLTNRHFIICCIICSIFSVFSPTVQWIDSANQSNPTSDTTLSSFRSSVTIKAWGLDRLQDLLDSYNSWLQFSLTILLRVCSWIQHALSLLGLLFLQQPHGTGSNGGHFLSLLFPNFPRATATSTLDLNWNQLDLKSFFFNCLQLSLVTSSNDLLSVISCKDLIIIDVRVLVSLYNPKAKKQKLSFVLEERTIYWWLFNFRCIAASVCHIMYVCMYVCMYIEALSIKSEIDYVKRNLFPVFSNIYLCQDNKLYSELYGQIFTYAYICRLIMCVCKYVHVNKAFCNIWYASSFDIVRLYAFLIDLGRLRPILH